VSYWALVHAPGIEILGRTANGDTGPAHAVYFASYEATKHALGGNEGESDEHHPLAAGAHCSTNYTLGGIANPPQLPVVLQPPSPVTR
jgi:hypothetical protein